jgi:hypothetical protein
MTNLEKVVRRRALVPFQHYKRRIVVSLEPGDILTMRLEGTRKMYRVPISGIFVTLCQCGKPDAQHREKARKKNARG